MKSGLAFSILFTVIPGMLVGSALPSFSLLVFTLLGTWLIACSSFVYNQIIEAPRDALMERTRHRPLASKNMSTISAHVIGSSLLFLGLYTLFFGAHPLAALVALLSFFYYVFIYTAILKPRTSLNTVLGGLSGSVGPLIGEAAVSGSVGEYGLAMFILLFLWQPAHFWCLAIHYIEDYRRVNLPVLPVAKGIDFSLKQIFLYQCLLCLAFVVVCIPPLNLLGLIFFIPSFLFGLFVLYAIWRLRHSRASGTVSKGFGPMRVFLWTIVHMVLWHIVMALDLYLGLWSTWMLPYISW